MGLVMGLSIMGLISSYGLVSLASSGLFVMSIIFMGHIMGLIMGLFIDIEYLLKYSTYHQVFALAYILQPR
ncbi:secreted protein [Candidatus Magnetomorum sp. HK-1]|nr:secreted protein [Candidatus Magnetomorum sp. HK-1]